MTEGRIISGRYQLLSKLGQGGMGSVYRGVHLELGTPVAVKLIEPSVEQSKVVMTRFKREAQAAASIRSNHVVQILDYGIDDETPYIVMELLEGESLAARISRQGVLPAAMVLNIMVQVGKALERAHAMNIVHRDLKPDNIFLLPDGDDVVAKVLDFGIAKTEMSAVFDVSIETKSGAILGTPHYMSPEQASGRGVIDQRSDIWALGVIVFECFTGFRPFTGGTLGGLVISICSDPIPRPSERGSVPQGLDTWFLKAVCRDKAGRFSSMREAVTALKLVCEGPMGAPLELTLGSLRREPTSIAGDFESVTVSPSSRTVGSANKRRNYTAWGIGATLFFALTLVTWFGRSRLPVFSAVVASQSSVVSSVSIPASVGSLTITSQVPSSAVAAPVMTNAALPSTISSVSNVALTTTVLRSPSSKTQRSPVRSANVSPSTHPITPSAEPPIVTPHSVEVEATRPTKTTKPIQKVEDRLAF